ncbi:MAG: hypothetical protein COA42_23135, partial [Alteromonadaceae bacterium]
MVMLLLASCGGAPTGNSGTATGSTTASGGAVAVSLALFDFVSGEATNRVSGTSPGRLRATVTLDGVALANEVVTFSTTAGRLDPASALTDSQGIAVIQLEDDGVAGAGFATAMVTFRGAISDDVVSFEVAGTGSTGGDDGGSPGNTGRATIVLTLINAETGISTNTISTSSPGQVQAAVTFEGTPLTNTVVTFATDLAVMEPNSALTNGSGVATINLNAGEALGAANIEATVTVQGNLTTEELGYQVVAGDGASSLVIVVELVDVATGLAIDTISSVVTGSLRATVTSNGIPVPNQVVTFFTELGQRNPASGTALTNTSGIATIALESGTESGADVVIASVTVSNAEVTDQVAYQVQADDGMTMTLSLLDATSTNLITTVSPINSGVLRAVVTSAGNPVPNVVVEFETDLGVFNPADGSALTDANGVAVVGLEASANVGADIVRVTATLGVATANGSISYQVAAGGDGGSVLDVNLTLVDPASGQLVNGVSATNPGELRALVTFGGQVLSGAVVRFDAEVGVLGSAAALTDDNGFATVTLEENGTAGAGVATAEVTHLDIVGRGTLNYQVLTGVGGITPLVLRMGSGTPIVTDFQEGLMDIGLAALSAGGTTVASVTIVDQDDALYTIPVDVNFTSGCVGTDDATIDSVVTTVNGVAAATYLAQGCVGADTITATTNISGTNHVASGSLTVAAADVGSLEFVSATPTSITLRETGGAGRSESSVIVFRVVDTQGQPARNREVSFALNSLVGGLSLDPAIATSDNSGLVQTTVQSGSVSTAVRVTASVQSDDGLTTLQSQSDQLVVTTGIPDQDSFDLSASIGNPEGWDFSGTEVTVTARLADRFNNPVPDGTAVTFTTEGGSIDSACTTVGGACSVIWRSQEARPCGQTLGQAAVMIDESAGPNVCVLEVPGRTNLLTPEPPGNTPFVQPFGGRATIVATAVGEESFNDVNGNGIFDDGDFFNDLAEAWRDDNEDGDRDPNEPFLDFNVNGDYDGADGEFNGVLCDHPDCSSTQSIHVRSEIQLVMSGSVPFFDLIPAGIDSETNLPYAINIVPNGIAEAAIVLSDLHNQPLPADTEIIVSVSTGYRLLSDSSFTVPSTSANQSMLFPISIEDTAAGGARGVLGFEVVSGNRDVTTPISIAIDPQSVNLVAELSSVTAVEPPESTSTVAQGDEIIYQITVTNSGNFTANLVTSNFAIDNGFSAVAITA